MQVFVPNVTTGLNAALRATEDVLGAGGGKILRTSLTYHATGLMVEHLAERTGAEVITLPVEMPVGSEEDAVDRFRKVQ